jgi:hypothetical protein
LKETKVEQKKRPDTAIQFYRGKEKKVKGYVQRKTYEKIKIVGDLNKDEYEKVQLPMEYLIPTED